MPESFVEAFKNVASYFADNQDENRCLKNGRTGQPRKEQWKKRGYELMSLLSLSMEHGPWKMGSEGKKWRSMKKGGKVEKKKVTSDSTLKCVYGLNGGCCQE